MKNTILFLLILIISSCTIGLEPDVDSPIDINPEFYMSTVSMIEGSGGVSSSATVPHSVIQQGVAFQDGGLSNYPEQGQITSWVVKQDGLIYEIEVTTLYPYSDYIDETVEVYYVQDDGDELYTTSDVTYNPFTQLPDPTYREEYYTEFENGDIRRETIEVINNESSFPSDYDGFNFQYSSVVSYRQTNSSFQIDGSNVRISGIRYYGERPDGSSLTIIRENGMGVNLVINGERLRGRSDVEGNITITIDSSGNKNISGEYIFSHRGNNYTFNI